MKQYQTFIFDSYDFDTIDGSIQLRYSLSDEVKFVETLTLPEGVPLAAFDPQTLNRALFALHLAGGVSYFKTCLPKQIEIRSGSLSNEQAAFWNDVYENGLGEFFYKNKIDFRGLINFPSSETSQQPTSKPVNQLTNKRVLVPIGGGKDSLVTMELLRAAGHDITLFRMGKHPFIDELAGIAGLPIINVKRALSSKLFELNEYGALNGHVPITAYLSAVTVVLSVLYGFDAIAMSSERSASEGNLEFHGKKINHQWSKSLEFERAFQAYLKEFVTADVDYFSMLRPLSELHIAKLLTQFPQYFRQFTSCNKNWTILAKPKGRASVKGNERWCGNCPKCAFAFTLMAAFLPKQTLLEIFGANLFDVPELQTYYAELLGLEGSKPFECVGTPEETAAAFHLAHKRGDLEDTAAMKLFVEKVLPKKPNGEALVHAMLTPVEEHVIPDQFVSALP